MFKVRVVDGPAGEVVSSRKDGQFNDSEEEKRLGVKAPWIALGVTTLVAGVLFFINRTAPDERLANAIERLSGSELTKRVEAIQSLVGLAEKHSELRVQVTERLVAFIRADTGTVPDNRQDVQEALDGVCALVDEYPEEAADVNFSASDLSGLKLGPDRHDLGRSSAVLPGAKFVGSVLIGTIAPNVDLTGAALGRANLTNANLFGATLRSADLSDADLTKAKLDKADLEKAHLDNAILQGTTLGDANLRGAILDGANLTETMFFKSDLSGASLKGADFKNAIFIGADFSGADLSGVRNWEEEQLKDAAGWNKLTVWPGDFKPSTAERSRD